MGWISHVFIAACFLGFNLKRTSGTNQVGTDPMEFNETEKKFAKVFIKNVMNSEEFGTSGNMDFREVTEALLKAISLLQQVKYVDGNEKEALMYAFASAIAELIVDQCDEKVGIFEKTNIVTNALQNAYLKTTGQPNYELIKEVRTLVLVFLSLDNIAENELLDPLLGPLGLENNYGFVNNYRLPGGFNRFGQIPGRFEPSGPPKFKLYYLNGTEVPQGRVQEIRRRYYRTRGPQPRLIPVGGAPSGPQVKYPEFLPGRYPLSPEFPRGPQFTARGAPQSPLSPQGSKSNGPHFPQENPQGPNPLDEKPESPLSPQEPTPGPKSGNYLSPISPQSTTLDPAGGKPKNQLFSQDTTPVSEGGKRKSPLSPQSTTPKSPQSLEPEEVTPSQKPFYPKAEKSPETGKSNKIIGSPTTPRPFGLRSQQTPAGPEPISAAGKPGSQPTTSGPATEKAGSQPTPSGPAPTPAPGMPEIQQPPGKPSSRPMSEPELPGPKPTPAVPAPDQISKYPEAKSTPVGPDTGMPGSQPTPESPAPTPAAGMPGLHPTPRKPNSQSTPAPGELRSQTTPGGPGSGTPEPKPTSAGPTPEKPGFQPTPAPSQHGLKPTSASLAPIPGSETTQAGTTPKKIVSPPKTELPGSKPTPARTVQTPAPEKPGSQPTSRVPVTGIPEAKSTPKGLATGKPGSQKTTVPVLPEPKSTTVPGLPEPKSTLLPEPKSTTVGLASTPKSGNTRSVPTQERPAVGQKGSQPATAPGLPVQNPTIASPTSTPASGKLETQLTSRPQNSSQPPVSTQNISQPDGQSTEVKRSKRGTTTGVVTEPIDKINKIILPSKGGKTQGILPGPIQVEEAQPGTTPGVITDLDHQVSKIIMPSTHALPIKTHQQPEQHLGPGMTSKQPGQPVTPGQTTQMLPQSGGKQIPIEPAQPGTTSGVVTGPGDKVTKVILPPGGGSTPGTLPGPRGKPIPVRPAKPGTTPGAIMGQDHQVSKIILPAAPVKTPQQPEKPVGPGMTPDPGLNQPSAQIDIPNTTPSPIGAPEGRPSGGRKATGQNPAGSSQNIGLLPSSTPVPNAPGGTTQQTYQPMGPEGSPRQPKQPMGPKGTPQHSMSPGGSPQQPVGPGGSSQQPKGPGGSPQQPQVVPQPGGGPIEVLPALPGTTPETITGPGQKISQVILPPGGGSTQGTIPGPFGRPIYIQPGGPGNTPGAVTGTYQQVTKIILPESPAPANAPLPKPGSSIVGQLSERTTPGYFNPQTATPAPNAAVYNPRNPYNNRLRYPGLPNNQNLFVYLPNFENIFTEIVKNGDTPISNLIQGVLQAKGQSSDTLDLREFIRDLSAVFGVMRYENPNLTYVELFTELMMETLIGTLEIIRASDPSCLVQPPTLGGIPKYANAFYDILI